MCEFYAKGLPADAAEFRIDLRTVCNSKSRRRSALRALLWNVDLVNRLHFRTAHTAVIAWSNVPCGGFCLVFCWWSVHRTVNGSTLKALDELSPPGHGRAMRRASEETAPIPSTTPLRDLIGHQ